MDMLCTEFQENFLKSTEEFGKIQINQYWSKFLQLIEMGYLNEIFGRIIRIVGKFL